MESHKVLFWVRYCFHSIQHHLVKLFVSTRILNSTFMPVTEDKVYKCISESPTKSCSWSKGKCIDSLASDATTIYGMCYI